MIRLNLPWPPAILNPNRKAHWRRKSQAAKKYNAECFLIANTVRPVFAADIIPLTLTFCAPDHRKRDDDNFVAAFKSGRDGIAAAWKIDDNRFELTIKRGEPIRQGGVIAEVRA